MTDQPRDPDAGSQSVIEVPTVVSSAIAPQHRRSQLGPVLATSTTISSEVYEDEMDAVPELSGGLRWRDVSEKRPQEAEPREEPNDPPSVQPPSFAQSEFETIVRRQKTKSHGLKIMNIPSRFPTLDNDWEFAGWGSMQYIELSRDDVQDGEKEMSQPPAPLDRFRAASIAGNGLVGSVFYAFPSVAAASGIFSPISLAVACLLLFLSKPVLLELGSAARSNGANYTYLLQFSGKAMGLVGAAVTLLDAMATSTVSAASASAYLGGEFASLSIPYSALSICLLFLITLIALVNTKGSTSITLAITFFHMVTMVILMVFSGISWARLGSATLIANWQLRPTSSLSILRDIFNGVCIGFLAVSGFECTPAYIELMKLDAYPSVINILIYSVLFLNAPLMLLVYAHFSSSEIILESNILSLLAEAVAGHWLRTLLVVDAMLVLCGGVVTGIFTAGGLLKTLALDGVLPQFFLREMLLTGQLFVPPAFFFLACVALYSTAAFQLPILSSVYSVAVLVVLLLYPVSNILLKFNRDRLPRQFRTSLITTLLAFSSMLTVLIGNLVLSPIALALFASYFAFLLASLFIIKSQTKLARVAVWLYGQATILQRFKLTRGLENAFVKIIRRTRRHAVCVWVKEDDIYNLVDSILYVRKNEPTARIVFIHAYQTVENIPSELAPNVKILDEAFPSITLDLVFVQGTFGPPIVQAVSKKMDIPRSRMFMSCFGVGHRWRLADYGGLRLIHH